MMPELRSFTLLAAAFISAALPQISHGQLRSERSMAGDTTIVRTLGVEPSSATRRVEQVLSFGRLDGPTEYVFGRISGVKIGPEGSIWVFDQQVPILRQYDSTGKYLRTVGRGGEGPGEYGALVGLAFSKDGGAIIQAFPSGGAAVAQIRTENPVHIFDARGTLVRSWKIGRGPRSLPGPTATFSTTGGMLADTAGALYMPAIVTTVPAASANGRPRSIEGMIRYDLNGTARDTIRPPAFGVEPPANMNATIPFAAKEYWSFNRFGFIAAGRTDRYQIHIAPFRNGVLRIERDIPGVAISEAERQSRTGQIPLASIPREKPFFSSLFTDEDGRIWVKLHTPSVRVPASELSAAQTAATGRGGVAAPASPNRVMFRESGNIFEVFASDGRYLGRVELPEYNYPPAIKGNSVWMQRTDAAGVPVVAKFRIVPPLPR